MANTAWTGFNERYIAFPPRLGPWRFACVSPLCDSAPESGWATGEGQCCARASFPS